MVSNVAVDPERFDDVKGKGCRYAFVEAMVSLASVELESSHNMLVFVSVLAAATATVFACGFRRGDATEQVPQGRDHQWIKDRFGKPKLNTAGFIGCFDRLCAATNFGCNVCGRVCTPEAKFLRSHHNNRSIREWLWMWMWLWMCLSWGIWHHIRMDLFRSEIQIQIQIERRRLGQNTLRWLLHKTIYRHQYWVALVFAIDMHCTTHVGKRISACQVKSDGLFLWFVVLSIMDK